MPDDFYQNCGSNPRNCFKPTPDGGHSADSLFYDIRGANNDTILKVEGRSIETDIAGNEIFDDNFLKEKFPKRSKMEKSSLILKLVYRKQGVYL